MLRLLPSLLTLLLAAFTCAAQSTERPPNIILIMADDLGYGELGCYGQEKIKTPRLDRMAAEGLRFTRYYAGAPVCAPTRCTLMTGKHSGHAFIRDNRELKTEGQFPLPAATRTLASSLKQSGYTTAMVGKWGLGGPGSTGEPNSLGFDFFFGYLCQREAHNYYPTHLWKNTTRIDLEGNSPGNLIGKRYAQTLFMTEIESFLRSRKPEPFFLYLPFTIPHVAIQAEEEDIAPYRTLPDAPYDGKQGYLPHPTPHAAYAAMVSRLDKDVGRILDLIAELGLDSSTIIFFCSDNGPTYDRIGGADSDFFDSAAGLRARKGSVYEGGIRVPLIARWPGKIRPGETCGIPCASYDLMPTLLDLARAPAEPGLDGISLTPALLNSGDQPRHDYLYWEFPSYGGQQALLAGKYKAVRQQMNKGPIRTELYDLAADEHETHDLAPDHPDITARLEALMKQAHEISPEFPFKPIDHP